jgi:hypothetical protein
MSASKFNGSRTRELYEPDTMRIQSISAGLHHAVQSSVVVAHKGVSGILDSWGKIVLDGEKSLGQFGNVR